MIGCASAKPGHRFPPGPFLVVGLARSGVAAPGCSPARGEEVIGVDSGRPAGAEGLAGRASKSAWMRTERALSSGPDVVKSPACPRRRR